MILAIDIGNTNINFGLFKDGMVKRWRIPSGGLFLKGARAAEINLGASIGKRYARNIEGVIVSSVVPKVEKRLKPVLKRCFPSARIIVLGKDARVPIKNLYSRPGEVGQDRLVNAFAALKECRRGPIIVADFGTALTFDVVSKSGAYMGGIIFPGLEVSLDALSERAALLPKIGLKPPKALIGISTSESMRSGIYYGFASLVDGLIRLLRREIGKGAVVLATGGAVREIGPFCSEIDMIDDDLTLKGLKSVMCHIYTINKRKKSQKSTKA